MGDRSKYHSLDDLYTEGKEVVFVDGTVMWVSALNPLEMDEARELAATARARMILALEEIGSDEQAKALAEFAMLDNEQKVRALLSMKRNESMRQALLDIASDPDWEQKLEIIERREAIMASAPEAAERELLTKITEEYFAEITHRVDENETFQREKYQAMEPEPLKHEWLMLYREQKGDLANIREFQFTQGWYAARCCEAVQPERGGEWDHSGCDHSERVYEEAKHFKAAPNEIKSMIYDALLSFTMPVREAKNLDSAPSSSDSSALQSPPEESTPSTQDATLVAAHGPST